MRKIILLGVILLLINGSGLVVANERPADAPVSVEQEGGPPVAQIGVDFGVVGGYRYLRVVGASVPVYDRASTRGTVIRTFQGGYDFVTPRGEQGNFTEINPGEWVETKYLREVYASYFRGVQILSEPAVPFGWILVTNYASATPGGPEVREAAYRIERYTITSLYEAVPVDGWVWYNVGGGRWVRQTNIGKVQRVANPGVGGRWVAVDLYEQVLVAYEGDAMVFATLVSSGLPGNDTRPGLYQIWARSANAVMNGERGGYGNYNLENVPYAMYFDGDISLHGTYWHNGFGYRQSRGCVNLSISDARWLYDWLGESGSVYVYYSQPY